MATNNVHENEVRDPIHNFIKYGEEEKKIINSRAFQRLRHINQLGLTYQLYPSATHKRFEHSLGVMEVATRIFDVITNDDNLTDETRGIIPKKREGDYKFSLSRKTLRVAALLHDVGHLPFSHGAEEILGDGKKHEDITKFIILNDHELQNIFRKDSIDAERVAKIATGPKYCSRNNESMDLWDTILSEIITSDIFGADRIDFLLRDSHHLGVAYGKFDHHRLLDTLRILPKKYEDSDELTLGIDEGGFYSAQSLLFARYLLYSQVCYHHVRKAYDLHLKDFMVNWLATDGYPTNDYEKHYQYTDNKVLYHIDEHSSEYGKADSTLNNEACKAANIIKNRKHFKLLYKIVVGKDETVNDGERERVCQFDQIFNKCKEKFGNESVKCDKSDFIPIAPVFPVQRKVAGRIEIIPSIKHELNLYNIPKQIQFLYIFVDKDILQQARDWLTTCYNVVNSED